MIPDPGEILRRRVTAVTVVRIATLVPIGIVFGIGSVWSYSAFTDYLRLDDHIAFAVSCLIFLGLAVILWAIAPGHAR